ncbi:general substrate transporter [Microdochium trichocladiopsis]|uniref:General substrate transporter n=1 Tax=Microdochium trichocladiopsis TaxID=1682393 RepID=A0A9P8YGB3_9PEZI|nr:general substrate transporter [Microdochium trichocladiopsis]KAH7037545.1 general substrate transporter [Microdochium trichocladiopsis]
MSEKKNAQEVRLQHVTLESGSDGAVLATSAPAAQFEAHQHAMTRIEAIKENWRALLWCMYAFYICVTFGYDGLAGSIVVSIAAFRKDFGTPFAGDYAVDANWQLGWLAGTIGGMVLGGFAAGLAINKWGRQPAIVAGFVVYIGGVFAQVFASSNGQFFVGKLLTGLPMGVFLTVAPTYGSEMAPLKIRGAVAAGMNFAIVLGQCILYGVMREAAYYTGSMQYKVLFMTQWGFCAVGLLIVPFFPESPYWLMARGREDKARQNLKRLHGSGFDIEGAVAEVKESLARVSNDKETQGSLSECFGRDQWRRTLVGGGMFFVQNASGAIWVVGNMAYFMQLAGLPPTRAADTSVGLSGLMVVGNMAGWFVVEKFGRRGSALYGSAALTVCLFLIGVLAAINVPNAIYGQIAVMGVWSVVYQATVGTAAWPIAAENATSRLRSSSQSIVTMINGLSSCIWAFSLPYAINPDQGNLGGKIAFVFGATMAVCTVFVFFCVPETKNRTYIEIDELWTRRIPPRHFAKTNIVTVGET